MSSQKATTTSHSLSSGDITNRSTHITSTSTTKSESVTHYPSPGASGSSSTHPKPQELPLLISPVVGDALGHNNRTLSTLHSPTSFLLGLVAGILSLHSLAGFIFYVLGTLTVSLLIRVFLVGNDRASVYFPGSRNGHVTNDGGAGTGAWRHVWFGGGVLGEGLSGFVLGWAGSGGVLR